MNILLWTLQIVLAAHTLIGAVWKISTTAQQTMPTLSVIPHQVWIAMSLVEVLCAIGLILPLLRRKAPGTSVILACIFLTIEMVSFSAIHFWSGTQDMSPVIYWLVVAGISCFIVFGRICLRPFPIKQGSF